VIIDFIDMESRRDQLMLLEHFTQAVRHDTARPQIAQLSELGLVELTRKRQGQNIYELFGRACPSCGGLGHVAVLPGTDTLQPLATVTGLVRSAASARAEVPSPATGESPGRRRGGRGGRGGRSAEPIEVTGGLPGAEPSPSTEAAETPFVSEPVSRRQESELVAVPMESDQELVYGWLGLNPALLLESPPMGDHLMVRIVRPGEDPDAVLEAARQQQVSSGSRRRRRGGRSGNEATVNGRPAAEDSPPFSSPAEDPEVLVEITPMPLEFEEARPPVTTVIEVPLVQVPLSRKVTRTRSASNGDGGPAAVAVVELPAEPEAETEGAEPRRRRRRSSATV